LASGREPASAEIALAADDSGSRKLLRKQCPDAPGVYGMVDAEGRLIYVGKSKSLRSRLVSYCSGSSLDSKSRRIITCTRRIVWEPAPHEFVALLRELELIRRFCPRFNVRGRPGRGRRAYVAMGREPAPRACLTEKASPRDRVLVGPLWPGRDLRRMVRVLNDCFGLRDCPGRIAVAFADQREMFARRSAPGCIRHALGTCLGPCTGACTSRRYADHVRRARAFLCGADRSILPRLEQAMRAAAAAERFQCAASIRDQWRDLTALDELLERVRTVERTYSFVYPLPSYRSSETWYLIDRGQVVTSVAAPTSPRSSRRAMEAMDKTYPAGPLCVDHATPDDPDLILLVSLWFRAHPEELERTLPPDVARRIGLELAAAAAAR
jgi:excinuclease ABC subunit C